MRRTGLGSRVLNRLAARDRVESGSVAYVVEEESERRIPEPRLGKRYAVIIHGRR